MARTFRAKKQEGGSKKYKRYIRRKEKLGRRLNVDYEINMSSPIKPFLKKIEKNGHDSDSMNDRSLQKCKKRFVEKSKKLRQRKKYIEVPVNVLFNEDD